MARLMSWVLACAVVALGAASVEAAKGDKPKRSPEEIFSKADKNGDKQLTLEEFVGKRKDEMKEKATKRFGKLDKDGDEFLSFDEFKAGFKKKKDK